MGARDLQSQEKGHPCSCRGSKVPSVGPARALGAHRVALYRLPTPAGGRERGTQEDSTLPGLTLAPTTYSLCDSEPIRSPSLSLLICTVETIILNSQACVRKG